MEEVLILNHPHQMPRDPHPPKEAKTLEDVAVLGYEAKTAIELVADLDTQEQRIKDGGTMLEPSTTILNTIMVQTLEMTPPKTKAKSKMNWELVVASL